jgi:hypothetical protein
MNSIEHKDKPTESGSTTTDEKSLAVAIEQNDPGQKRSDKAGGPRTEMGKQRSSRNSLKHGIFATKNVLLPGESRAQFEALLEGLRDSFHLEGVFGEILIRRLGNALRRECRSNVADTQADIGTAMDTIIVIDKTQQWQLLLRYQTGASREIDRILAQIEKYKLMCVGHPAPSINLNVSST